MKKKTAFSKITIGERKSSDYGTPLDFFNKLNSIFLFETDPCASSDNRLGLCHVYKKEDDGLAHSWPWNTFINPPFGTKKGEKIVDWIRKMKVESNGHQDSTYVMLLPARIESNWFQDEIFSDVGNCDIYVVKGRLSFYNKETNANNDPHPIGTVLYIRGRDILAEQYNELHKTIPGVFIEKKRLFRLRSVAKSQG